MSSLRFKKTRFGSDMIVIYHHIRFWYLPCCGCPGLRGR